MTPLTALDKLGFLGKLKNDIRWWITQRLNTEAVEKNGISNETW